MPIFWSIFIINSAEFCQRLFFKCFYWVDHMVFMFQVVNMVYHIDWFVDIEESLYPWNKPYLIVVYELFNVVEFCLLKLYWGFLNLYSSVILACNFLFCVVFVWFWFQGDCDFIEWVWMCSFLCNFFGRVLEV